MHAAEVRGAVLTSLQGGLEESSPGDQMDTRRIGEGVAARLAGYGFQILLLNRDDYPAGGDQYLAAIKAAQAWGAQWVLNIHQDDWGRQSQSGWMVCHNPQIAGSYEYAVCMRDMLAAAIPFGPSVPGGLQARVPGVNGVAVLNYLTSILVECGYYRNSTDEQVAGLEQWVSALTVGTLDWLIRKRGLILRDKEDDDMAVVRFDRLEQKLSTELGREAVVFAAPVRSGSYVQLYADVAEDFGIHVFLEPEQGPYAHAPQGMGGYMNAAGNHGLGMLLEDLLPGAGLGKTGRATLTVHVPAEHAEAFSGWSHY